MSNIHSLHQRINKMLAHIEQQLPEDQAALLSAFSLHLFTDQEVERLYSLLELVESKCELLASGRPDYRALSDEELDQLHLWLELDQALKQEDIGSAAYCRRRLSIGREQLIQAFLALDESSIPEFDQAPRVTQGHVIYTLYRTNFRSYRAEVERALSRTQPTFIDLDVIHMWVDAFSTAAAA